MSASDNKYLENFEHIGEWGLDDKYASNKALAHLNLSGINFQILKGKKKLKDVIYLFRSGTTVIYIGETSRGIQDRFTSYRYGFNNETDTDTKVKIGITKRLNKGEKIEILCWKPTTEYTFAGEAITVPLSKPIEEFLIAKLGDTNELMNVKSKQVLSQ